MHKHVRRQMPLQRRVVNRIIFVVAAVQPLGTVPQLIAIYSTHNATGVSIWSWAIFVVFDFIWLWYGIDEKDKAIIVSAIMFGILESSVMAGAIAYGGHW